MQLNVLLRFVPTVPITVTAATAINAAIRPYSIAVAPSSFLRSFMMLVNIDILLGADGRRMPSNTFETVKRCGISTAFAGMATPPGRAGSDRELAGNLGAAGRPAALVADRRP
jgi:hypothetical protein